MAESMPQAGDAAPAFEGTTHDGHTLSLGDFAGSWLLLYFYPKDDTPGCTKQACNLRDHLADLKRAGVAVVGVSPDDGEAHGKFTTKYDLPFPLLADPDKTILQAYGTWGEKNLYGKKSMGVKRTSFLIDPEGVVRHVFKRPRTEAHAEEVLAKLGTLG
jgi:peroxiredoxin Q/BCP